MQILFKHPRPEHPFWRKKHSRQRIFALAVRLENHKNDVFRCASATFAHPKCHSRRVQVPFSSTLSATSTQYSRCEYWSLALRVLEFSSASTQRKCHNSTCFYEVTPQPIKYQHVVLFVLSTPPKLAKNAPTICFLIFCALLSGQTYKYRVRAKGVPRTRGEGKRAERAKCCSGGLGTISAANRILIENLYVSSYILAQLHKSVAI